MGKKLESAICTALYFVLVGYLVFKLPEIHYQILRSYVGDRIVKVTNKEGTSGGTGFHVRAKSGKTFILTNSHVCKVGAKEKIVYIKGPGERLLPKKIVEDSDFTDLCLVEPLEGIDGLDVASEEELGKIVHVIGHPKLMPITLTSGELTGKAKVQVLSDMFPAPGSCDDKKSKRMEIPFFFMKVPVCVIEIDAYSSNIQILPGNSGSPLVNFYGDVIGVAFAGGDGNWGFFVTLEDINRFLGEY